MNVILLKEITQMHISVWKSTLTPQGISVVWKIGAWERNKANSSISHLDNFTQDTTKGHFPCFYSTKKVSTNRVGLPCYHFMNRFSFNVESWLPSGMHREHFDSYMMNFHCKVASNGWSFAHLMLWKVEPIHIAPILIQWQWHMTSLTSYSIPCRGTWLNWVQALKGTWDKRHAGATRTVSWVHRAQEWKVRTDYNHNTSTNSQNIERKYRSGPRCTKLKRTKTLIS